MKTGAKWEKSWVMGLGVQNRGEGLEMGKAEFLRLFEKHPSKKALDIVLSHP